MLFILYFGELYFPFYCFYVQIDEGIVLYVASGLIIEHHFFVQHYMLVYAMLYVCFIIFRHYQ